MLLLCCGCRSPLAARLARSCLAALGIAALMLPMPALAADNPREARVKAAYLFNLSLFVDWTDLPADSFTLCVSGDSGIGSALAELEARPVKERPLRILREPADPAACQLLFIGRAHTQWQGLLQQLAPGVLTVGDHADFVAGGGVVRFYNDAGKVKLEVSRGAAERAVLRISSRVLELARVLP